MGAKGQELLISQTSALVCLWPWNGLQFVEDYLPQRIQMGTGFRILF